MTFRESPPWGDETWPTGLVVLSVFDPAVGLYGRHPLKLPRLIQAHTATARCMKDGGRGPDERIVFDRLPGGVGTFSLVIDFCYGLESFKVCDAPSYHQC